MGEEIERAVKREKKRWSVESVVRRDESSLNFFLCAESFFNGRGSSCFWGGRVSQIVCESVRWKRDFVGEEDEVGRMMPWQQGELAFRYFSQNANVANYMLKKMSDEYC
ncbi:hypothetical protein COLO4_04337 [Corchorus olitorius]|uniref:Uncharacterized protein n=1 Tax=Corchorus olitorius TaxID=93759 RepID=A0A1R3KUI8_9ROSI|nr:hypothetical protein COLO4_04337 [Corchorus olitorius]